MLVLKTFRDGSRAIDKLTKREFQTARYLAHIAPRPSVREITAGEARTLLADDSEIIDYRKP